MDRVDVEQWKGREVARLLALVESERRYYQEIVASLPVGLAVIARDGSIQSANRCFRSIYELRPEDVHRRTLDQLIHDPAIHEAVHDMPAKGALPAAFAVEHGERHLKVSLVPVRDWDDDTDVEVLLVVEEMTGMSLPQALHDLPALIWSANAQSLEFSVISGKEAEVAHPGFASARIFPDDRDRVVEFYRNAFETPGPHACEYRATNPEGRIVWLRDTFTVTAASDSKPEKAAGVVTDVTLRKQNEAIEQQAQRQDALAGLTRVMTHDLNNPLMIVTGYAEDLLASLPESDARRNDVQEILNAAQRMSGLTSQLLNFTHKQGAAPEPVNLVAILTQSGIQPGTVPGSLRVIAEAPQLTTALKAILERLRRDGEVTVDASPLRISELTDGGLPRGNYVDISLVAPGHPAVSFDSLLPSKDALGPELARARALAHEWGGGVHTAPGEIHLVLRSAPAEVATVKVEEPARIVEPVPAAQEETPLPLAETILVVEDEGGIRALVRKILRRQNYNVLEAGSPKEAVELVAAHSGKIHLLITDMTLPERSGRQLAEELKQRLPQLKVLYVSGYSDDPLIFDREQLPEGAAFLQKPFTLGSLLKRVREVLDQNSPEESAASYA